MKQGPNVRKLIIRKMSNDAVPAGGGIGDALNFITKPGAVAAGAKAAAEWVESAITVVRLASDPNPWKDADDEAIAGEILRQIKEKGESKP